MIQVQIGYPRLYRRMVNEAVAVVNGNTPLGCDVQVAGRIRDGCCHVIGRQPIHIVQGLFPVLKLAINASRKGKTAKAN